MKRTEKDAIIGELTGNLTSYKYVYITDTSSLSANKTNELRRSLFKQGIKMRVAKNTLIKKAIEQSGLDYGDMLGVLKGTSALMFCEDPKTPAKAIKDFRKGSEKPLLKGAYIDTAVFIGDNQLDTLTKLKNKQELIGEIIGLLQSPASNVISALQSGGGKLAGILKTLSEKES